MTRIEARKHKIAWNVAISEGRVVRFSSLGIFRSYATPEAAQAGLAVAVADGIEANLVPTELASVFSGTISKPDVPFILRARFKEL